MTQLTKIVTGQETPSKVSEWAVFLVDRFGPWALISALLFWSQWEQREDKKRILDVIDENTKAQIQLAHTVNDLSKALDRKTSN